MGHNDDAHICVSGTQGGLRYKHKYVRLALRGLILHWWTGIGLTDLVGIVFMVSCLLYCIHDIVWILYMPIIWDTSISRVMIYSCHDSSI